jgi:hypothetical protein
MTPKLRHSRLQLGGEGNGGEFAKPDLQSELSGLLYRQVYRCAWRLHAEDA